MGYHYEVTVGSAPTRTFDTVADVFRALDPSPVTMDRCDMMIMLVSLHNGACTRYQRKQDGLDIVRCDGPLRR